MLYIFGAGYYGQITVKHLRGMGIYPSAIIDNDKSKQGLRFFNDIIYPPEILKTCARGIIIISVWEDAHERSIATQLEDMGFHQGVDFYFAKELLGGLKREFDSVSVSLPEGFQVASAGDYRCVSVYKEDGRFYQLVTARNLQKYREVISALETSGMLGHDFVAMKESDELAQTHPDCMFLECETLQPDTNFRLWPPAMLKDYALWCLDFIAKLDDAGLGYDDGFHNVTYSGGRFVCYGLGGISLDKTPFFTINFLLDQIINPLVLISCGEMNRPFREFMNVDSRLCFLDIVGYMTDDRKLAYEKLMCSLFPLMLRNDIQSISRLLKEYVLCLPMPDGSYAGIAELNYAKHQLQLLANNNYEALRDKYKNAVKLIRTVNPKSLVDLASNSGVISFCLKDELSYAINIDIHAGALDLSWQFMNENEEYRGSSITPIRLDIIRMFETYTPRNYCPYLKGTPVETHFERRLTCEMAVCLSIIHHMVFLYLFSFEQAIKCFLFYTNKYLLIEFVDIPDMTIQNGYVDQIENITWYNKDNFEKELKKVCNILEIMPSDADTRSLYLCEIKGEPCKKYMAVVSDVAK